MIRPSNEKNDVFAALAPRRNEPQVIERFIRGAVRGIWHAVRRRLWYSPQEHEDAFQRAAIAVATAVPLWDPTLGEWFGFAYVIADRAVKLHSDSVTGRFQTRGRFGHISLEAPLAEGFTIADTLADSSAERNPEVAFAMGDLSFVLDVVQSSKAFARDQTGALLESALAIAGEGSLAEIARQRGVTPQAISAKWSKFCAEMRPFLIRPVVGRLTGAADTERQRENRRRDHDTHREKVNANVRARRAAAKNKGVAA